MQIQSSPVQEQPPEARPRPFSQIPSLWLQLPRMTRDFFSAEAPRTSVSNTFLGVLIHTVLATLVLAIVAWLRPATGPTATAASIRTATLVIAGFTVFLAPLSFYLNTGMNYVSAYLFGGRGRFSEQAYLASLFIVPLGIISSFISFLALIPLVGTLLETPFLLIIVVITTIFQYRIVRVVHGLNSTRAAAAVLVPLVLIYILICLAVFLLILLLFVLSPNIRSLFPALR